MITDLFSSLLEELQEHLKMKDLQPDVNSSCLIKFPTGLEIQIEPDKRNEFLIVAVKFENIPQSRYKENILREALRANSVAYPRYGTFAYSKKSDRLMLFSMLHMKDLSGLKIFEHLKPFSEKAFQWKEALQRGEIPPVHQTYSTTEQVGMFGGN